MQAAFWGTPPYKMAFSPIVNLVLFLSLFTGALLLFVILMSRHRKAGASGLRTMGMNARVETILNPEGSIILDGELMRARANQGGHPIEPGVIVRVVGASGHLLVVEMIN